MNHQHLVQLTATNIIASRGQEHCPIDESSRLISLPHPLSQTLWLQALGHWSLEGAFSHWKIPAPVAIKGLALRPRGQRRVVGSLTVGVALQ